jgi:hypothetical protein
MRMCRIDISPRVLQAGLSGRPPYGRRRVSGSSAARLVFRFERRLRRRNPVLGEVSEGAVEAPSDINA